MRLLVESDPLRIRIALLEGERLAELHVDGERPSRVGDVYLGRVQRLVPAIDAAFVDIGFQRKAFLHADDFGLEPGAQPPTHGAVIVQVFRDEVPGKGSRVRCGISLPGRHLVLLSQATGVAVSSRIDDPEERERLTAVVEEGGDGEVGWIARTAAAGVGADALAAEAAELLATWRGIQKAAANSKPPKLLHRDLASVERWLRDRVTDEVREIWVDSVDLEARLRGALAQVAPDMIERIQVHHGSPTLFERFGVESQLAGVWNRRVALPAGGSLVIEPTEALVAIDVNSGKDLGGSTLEATALATNLEAAREAAHQMRLRDLAGIIVIDFIDMGSAESWELVVQALEEELARDRATTMVDGPVGFGLVAITRKRSRNDLLRRLSVECPACRGSGRLRSPVEVAAEARRELLALDSSQPGRHWRLWLHPDAAVAVEDQVRSLLDELGERLQVETRDTLGLTTFEITEAAG